MTTPVQQLEEELIQYPYRVVVVAGIGASLATCGRGQPCATWIGLLQNGLQRCAEECGTAESVLKPYRDLLSNPSAPPHVWIGVGQFITDELRNHRHGLYAKWLEESIGEIRVTDARVVRALDGLGAKLATTNYDDMIEAAAGTGKTPITWRQHARATSFFREQTQDVLHLHGHYREPDSVILGARTYGDICRDQATQDALRWHLRFGTFVFVGCGAGLEDPNFGSLLEWSRAALAEDQHSHFILVPDPEVPSWRERLRRLPIQPVGYGAGHAELAPFLEDLGRRVQAARHPHPLPALIASQTDFDSQWDGLEAARGELTDSVYFRRSRDLAAQLWAAGGRHRAALAFSGRVTYQGKSLPTAEYVEFALEAAEWLLDDEVPDLASHHLDEVRRRVETEAVPAGLLTRFRRLQVRCLDALCAYTEALRAIEEALPGAGPEERQRLQAEWGEIHFLQGDYDQALRDWEV